MEARMNLYQLTPAAYKAVLGLEAYIDTTGIDRTHRELIKIRASQINGCAFCINMHTKDARKYGETEQRIYLLNAWRETNLFTEEEKVILAFTEEATLIANGGVSEPTFREAVRLFGETYVSHILMTIVAINAWNRIAITSHTQPE